MLESEFIQLISSVGFPIAMCILLVIYGKQAIENNTKAIQEMNITMIEVREHLKK